MLERISDCICHPRFIGKYNKDKVGKIILCIILFFSLYLVFFGIRCYTENPFGSNASSEIVSSVIKSRQDSVVFDTDLDKLLGEGCLIKGDGFNLYVLPSEDIKISKYEDFYSINIILDEEEAIIYYGISEISKKSYKDINVNGFSFAKIINNQVEDLYSFNIFIQDILLSSEIYFQTYLFLEGAMSALITYIIIVLICFAFAYMINPTIDRKVRIRLCLYDGLIFFVVSMLASLFNAAWLVYVGYCMPVIYTTITFRHIVRVVIKK